MSTITITERERFYELLGKDRLNELEFEELDSLTRRLEAEEAERRRQSPECVAA